MNSIGGAYLFLIIDHHPYSAARLNDTRTCILAMTFKHPSEIYAEEMAKYREGYGLWIPDPRDTGVPQAEIGDVGFISDGAFDLLFNYSTESSHLVSVNPPDNLDKRKIFHRKHKNVFGPGFYRSTSVRELECALSGYAPF